MTTATKADLFGSKCRTVHLFFAPKAIFERNLLEVFNGKTYKPTIAEVQTWNCRIKHYASARELIAKLANAKEARVERSPVPGDVIQINDGKGSITYWVLAPIGGFWLLEDDESAVIDCDWRE